MSLAAISNGFAPNAVKPNKKRQVIVGATDTKAFSDAAARSLRHPRAGADALSFSDGVTRSLLFARQASDRSAASDALTRGLRLARASADSESFGETFNNRQGRAAVDSFSFSELLTRRLSLGRGSADTAAFADGAGLPGFPAGVVVDLLRLQTENAPYSEDLDPVVTSTRGATDTVVTLDTADARRGLLRALVDALSTSDNAVALRILLRVALDEFSLDELPIKASGLLREFLDGFSFSDEATVSVTLNNPNATTVQFADIVGTLRDPATVAVDLLRLGVEQQSYSEALTVGFTGVRAVSDSFSFNDFVTAFTNHLPPGVIGAAVVAFVSGGGKIVVVSGGGEVSPVTGDGEAN